MVLAGRRGGLIQPQMEGLELGGGTARLVEELREVVPMPGEDRFFRRDLDAALRLVRSGGLLGAEA